MKVSIITAVLNRKDEIKPSLDSLTTQTYRNIEHIVVDGKSTDGTLEILREYKESVRDYEVILVSEKDNGLYEALNRGLKLSTGDVVGVLHAGDLLADENVLETVVRKFEELQDADGIYGDVVFFNNKGIIVRETQLGEVSKEKVFKGWHPVHTALFLKRSVYNELGFYREDLDIASDYEYILRAILKGNVKLVYVNKTLVKMKTGGKSGHTPKKLLKKLEEDLRIIGEYKLPYYALITKRLYKIYEFMKPFMKS